MANSADLDQLASLEVNWSGSTPFAKGRMYLGSVGLGLNTKFTDKFPIPKQIDKELPNTSTSLNSIIANAAKDYQQVWQVFWKERISLTNTHSKVKFSQAN